MAYSGSLQRVDFSEEADEKGFCIIDLDLDQAQGQRLADFRFERIAARPFVTVDATVPENEDNPTAFVVNAIDRRPVAGSIVRLRLRLSGEQSGRVRDADLRAALSPAHYVASISRDLTDETRRRLDTEATDLQPMTALRLYLENQGVSAQRQRILLERAEELLASVDGQAQ